MDYTETIEYEGYRYTFAGPFKERCEGCIILKSKECTRRYDTKRTLLEKCMDISHKEGNYAHCIKKEKIEEKPVYKPGMKVVITKDYKTKSCDDDIVETMKHIGDIVTLKETLGYGRWCIAECYFTYNEAWFKPYTEEKETNGMKETKYELVKDLTINELIQAGAYSNAMDDIIRKYGKEYGFTEMVKWTPEVERYAGSVHDGIGFLKRKGFITERKTRIVFDEYKFYTLTFKLSNKTMFILRTSGNGFSLVGLENEDSGLCVDQPFEYFIELENKHPNLYRIEEFHCVKEAMECKHIDGM